MMLPINASLKFHKCLWIQHCLWITVEVWEVLCPVLMSLMIPQGRKSILLLSSSLSLWIRGLGLVKESGHKFNSLAPNSTSRTEGWGWGWRHRLHCTLWPQEGSQLTNFPSNKSSLFSFYSFAGWGLSWNVWNCYLMMDARQTIISTSLIGKH